VRGTVFLDRDGTINEEVCYLDEPNRLSLIPGVAEAIRLLNDAGMLVIVVSNQSGVGRGYFSTATLEAIHQQLAKQLATHGARVDAIYYCPHQPSEGCECRKPKAGMLVRAAQEHGIDMRRSFMVGDKVSDLDAGRQVGCRAVLVLTGYGERTRETSKNSNLQPDHISTDLYDAVEWILAEEGVVRV
jgi:D-glycero-D-manno-heptose 1,7-bisphosphate phosphatase